MKYSFTTSDFTWDADVLLSSAGEGAWISPVRDTSDSNTVVRSFSVIFNSIFADIRGISQVGLVVRTSDTSWTAGDSPAHGTAPRWSEEILISTDEDLEDTLSNNGFHIFGRYFQIGFTNIDSTPSDNISSVTTVDIYVERVEEEVISLADTAYENGKRLRQNVVFSNPQQIGKVSLNIKTNNTNREKHIRKMGKGYSYPAANFVSPRDSHKWKLDAGYFNVDNQRYYIPLRQGYLSTIQNGTESDAVSFEQSDAKLLAPFAKYKILFEETGVYSVWMKYFCDVEGGFWLQFDDSESLIPVAQSNSLDWVKNGHMYVGTTGEHSITLYQGRTGEKYIDSFYVVQGTDASVRPHNEWIQPLSPGPYNTFLSVEDNDGGYANDWVSSADLLTESGKFNFNMQGITFSNKIFMTYTQIGGNENFFAAWRVVENEESNAGTKVSTDWGQTYGKI